MWSGREDDGTGLYYYRARYYSPIYQRFISEDPLGFAGGVNLYAYAGDNPVGFADPFGLKPNRCQAFYCSPWGWNPSGDPGNGGRGSNGWGPPGAPNPNPPQPKPIPKRPNPNKPPCQDPATAQQQALGGVRQYVYSLFSLFGFNFSKGGVPTGPPGAPVTLPTDIPGAYGAGDSAVNAANFVNSAGQMGKAISNAFNSATGNCTPQ